MLAMTFDEISKSIIRRFQWPRGGDCTYVGKPSVYRIAKDLNVHPKVVKSRLKEMFDSGLIRGVKFYAEDRVMPWKRYFILIEKTRGIAKVVAAHFHELQFVERMIFGTLYVPHIENSANHIIIESEFTSISVIAFDEEDLNRKIKLIESSIGCRLNVLEVLEESVKKSRLLNERDLAIVNAILAKNPLTINLNDLAHELKIPLRTIRRRVEELLHDDVIYEEVSLDTSKSIGLLISCVILEGDYHGWLPIVSTSKFLKDRLLLYKNFSKFSFFIFHTESFSAIDKLSAEMSKINLNHFVTYRNGSYNNPYINYFELDRNIP